MYFLDHTVTNSNGTLNGNNVTLLQSTTNTGVFEYTLVSVKESSLTQCSQLQTGTATVTIKATPLSNLSASKVDVCPNTEVTLSPNCSVPTADVQWNPGAPTVTPNAPDIAYTYKVTCSAEGCIGNESTVEIRTHRILVDMKEVGMGTMPQPILSAIKDNMAPTNTIMAPALPRRWTFIANGCSISESAVFKLAGPVNFNTVDNNFPYAMFANDGSNFYSIAHPNYGNGSSFPNGTYTLTVDLRAADGIGGPFPKNRLATGALLATRSLQFTIGSLPERKGVAESVMAINEELTEEQWLSVDQNPVNTEVTVRLSGRKGQSIELSLVNLQGKFIHQRSFQLTSAQQSEVIPMGHAASGLYILKAVKGDKVKSLKVIK